MSAPIPSNNSPARRFRKILAAILSAGITLVAVEVAVRLLEPPGAERAPEVVRDEELGWVRPPNQGGFRYLRNFAAPELFRVRFRTNSRGLRDREYPIPKGEKLRVLALGDSLTEGWGVEEDQAYPNVLEDRFLCGVEVWNMGVNGYATDQELLQLRRVIAEYKPDLVTLGFYHNDLLPNIRKFDLFFAMQKPLLAHKDGHLVLTNGEDLARIKQGAARRRNSRSRRLQVLLNRSALFRLAFYAVNRGAYLYRSRFPDPEQQPDPMDENPNHVPPGPQVQRAWQMTELILAEISTLSKQYGATFLLTYIPSTQEIVPGVLEQVQQTRGHVEPRTAFDLAQAERTLAELARRNGIHFVEMGSQFRKVNPPQQLYLPNLLVDEHLSDRGQFLVAQTLAQYLRDQQLLPAKNFCPPADASHTLP